jgi:DNA polymerase-3 subunit gamma/tau
VGYLVLARKWRPQSFEEVVGQAHVTTTLANAIKSERVGHAYLFTGPRGVGKTTTARILARALNCVEGPTPKPCGKCDTCRSISAGSNLDVLEIDGASNRGIDDVRELREQVRYAPSEGRYKVYIIDEVHMLTDQAFNALLKTLEEPPAHVVFIFATTSPLKIPVTILSRCQRFDFNLITAQEILKRLKGVAKKEKFSIDDGALALVARKARGSLRDAESLLDQVTSAAEGAVNEDSVTELLGIGKSDLYFALCGHINKSDAGAVLGDADSALREGLDVGEFMKGLIEHLRSLFLLSVDSGLEEALDAPSSELPRYKEQSGLFKQKELLRLLEIASEAAAVMRRSEDPRFHAEVALAKMADAGTEEGLTDIVRRLVDLESRLASGDAASPRPVEGRDGPAGGRGGSTGKAQAKKGSKGTASRKKADGAKVDAEAQEEDDELEGAGRGVSAGASQRFAVGATGVEPAEAGSPANIEADTIHAGDDPSGARFGEAPFWAGEGPARVGPIESWSQDQLEEQWSEVVRRVGEKKTYLRNFLSLAVPVEATSESLALGFPEGCGFHKDQVSANANKRLVQEAMEHVFGKFLGLRFLTVEKSAGEGRAASERSHDAAAFSGPRPSDSGTSSLPDGAMLMANDDVGAMPETSGLHPAQSAGLPGEPTATSGGDVASRGSAPGGGATRGAGFGSERVDEPLRRVLRLFEGEIVEDLDIGGPWPGAKG